MLWRWKVSRSEATPEQSKRLVRTRLRFLFRFVDEDMDGFLSFRQFILACIFTDIPPPPEYQSLRTLPHGDLGTHLSVGISFPKCSQESFATKLGTWWNLFGNWCGIPAVESDVEMTSVISHYRGTLIEFIGDAILAVWNAPLRVKLHMSLALAASLEMQRIVREKRPKWTRPLAPGFYMRCGVHTARVMVGNMGSPGRIKFGVLGDGVNLASRLEELNNRYGTAILTTEVLAENSEVSRRYILRPLDYVVVKGRRKSTFLYEVLCHRKNAPEALLRLEALQYEAMQLYLNKDFDLANAKFREIIADFPAHLTEPVSILHERSISFEKDPPSVWPRAEQLHHKYF
eukprot:Polyplicarium_translucidae@DN3025_c0_g1_i10.p1